MKQHLTRPAALPGLAAFFLGATFSPSPIAPPSQRYQVATLVVGAVDGHGAVAGTRQGQCQMKVVSCNYAHNYSGTFIWSKTLTGSASRNTERVQVEVVRGVASCNGAETDTENGRTLTGPVVGPGLIAVEFEKNIYRITVACPSPDWPATPDAAATPSRPAELGHNDQQSYDQPAPPPGANLVGSYSNPAPETDPVNAVTGLVTVSWELCAPARYRVVANKVCS